jgi:hypothetical protein
MPGVSQHGNSPLLASSTRGCRAAWDKDPAFGVIGVQSGPRGLDYEGSYDSVLRYGRSWRKERGAVLAQAYVPLSFAPGEA